MQLWEKRDVEKKKQNKAKERQKLHQKGKSYQKKDGTIVAEKKNSSQSLPRI